MRIFWLTLCTFALLLPTMAMPPQPVTLLLTTVREIVSTTGIFLSPVAQSKQESWVVIRIVTDQFSGCGTISTSTPGGSIPFSGSYMVMHQLGAAIASPSGRYSWSQPLTIMRAAFNPLHPDQQWVRWHQSFLFFGSQSVGNVPQSTTRYLLCILHEKVPGQDKFTDVHLIPAGWQEEVLPAVRYLRVHPTLAASPVALRGLLHDPNPYLVVTALQLLAAGRSLAPADLDAVISSGDPKLIASSIILSRLYSCPDGETEIRWLMARVPVLKSMEQLEGVALGLLATDPLTMNSTPLPTDDLPGQPSIGALFGTQNNDFRTKLAPAIRQRLKVLEPGGAPADDRWRAIDFYCRQFGV